ncbi:uncharacterized protein LOC119110428 [Pollicipes pollicipes]|uniref:uncharacterized protein LOC119110428 n=1 Tax=Pollicipes pollicipes TaxID=41117 RepID=UPI001884EE9F|nr:uncharacterized protein LOC119110428 [Pollicipes pollicipes]XP_037090149.1 uncharacterized protein LOC119110428 [Pollicipes pollicipes]XP_037090150.1 uncharacterized protein LOC119110428 [Pollicipes pollicipes]XP_037090151.1 uncharacterized protein LOC119110428 [Pollicipes pollicipes]XP_037090152.1 uncharacterized protein LOC119110428 [Pollicipes pollicipes]
MAVLVTGICAARRPGVAALLFGWGGRLAAPCHIAPSAAMPAPLRLSVARTLHMRRLGNPRSEERWRQRDGMPAGFRLVYLAPMEWYVRAAAAAGAGSLLLAAVGVLAKPAAAAALLAANAPLLLVVGMYALISPSLLVLAWRYPFRMYHSAARREFRAVLTGPLVVTLRHVTLADGAVSRVENASNILPWKKVLYRSDQGKLILIDSAFQSAEVYNRLLGYPQPEDDDEECGDS